MSIGANPADGLGVPAVTGDRGGRAGGGDDPYGGAGGPAASGFQPRVAVPPGAAPEPPATSALRAVDLTLSFGHSAVLSNITTDIRKGAVTALIGPTGSGKTTLLRTFNR